MPQPAQNTDQNNNVNTALSAEGLAERRYLWTARAFAVVSAVAFCCNIALFFAIFQILPLVRVEPFMVSFHNKGQQIVNIKPMAKDMSAVRNISETFVRQYILLRNTFVSDVVEMKARWFEQSPIQEMSSPAVYEAFLSIANRALALVTRDGLTRDVKITSSNEISKGIWQVEFETYDMTPDAQKPKITKWAASLRISYRKKRVSYEERLKNPLGFTVIEYSVARDAASSVDG